MITPEQIAKDSEHSQQVALFCWAAQQRNDWLALGLSTTYEPQKAAALANLFAIPNGDQRGDGTTKGAMIAGGRLKAEGQRNGVPDIFLAWPKKTYGGLQYVCCGLFIEMKRPGLQTHKNGSCSLEQIEWHKRLVEAGYAVKVCYSWQEARDAILEYLYRR